MLLSLPKSYLLYFLLIVGTSMLLRWDGPADQRGGIHFWLSAQCLQTFEIWEENGVLTYAGNPVETYPEASNMHQPVPGHTFLADAQGQYYYTSYPPLGLLLPYAVHQALHINPSVISLRIWSLILYLSCLLLLFAWLWQVSPDHWALIGTAAFAFSPGPLYYLSHIYFSDMLALFWLFALLWAVQRQLRGQNMWLWLIVLNFCACYTEWLGMLFALVAGVWLSRTQKSSRWFWSFGISGLAALGLCIFQYSQIAGLDALLAQWLGRLNTQSGADISIWQGLGQGFFLNQFRNYGVVILGIGALLIVSIWQKKLPQKWPILLSLALVAPFAHQLLFLQFGYLHDFAGLKSGPFWLLLLVWLGHSLGLSLRGTLIPVLIGGLMLVTYGTLRYHTYVQVPNPDIALGKVLQQQLSQQDSKQQIYFLDKEPNPILHYYAKRNFAQWQTEQYADSLMQVLDLPSAVLIQTQDPSKPVFQNLQP